MTKKNVPLRSARGKAEGSKGIAVRNGWQPELVDIARAMIEDADTYDARTRERISRALKEEDERLPEIVKAAEILAAGEPADKTSDAWRYWKLRSIEADLESGDAERQREAGAFISRLTFDALTTPSTAAVGVQLLPFLIHICQQRNPTALAEDEDKPSRRDARRVLERTKRVHDASAQDERSGYYKPITLARAVELAEQIVTQDDDDVAHAFITLLHGLVAAYIIEKRDGSRAGDLEGLVLYATRAAYAQTIHASTGKDEFAQLAPGTLAEVDALRSEYFGGEGEA